MDKIEIHYNRRTPEVIEADEVVSGQRGTVEAQFSFSEDWERYPIRSASFSSSADKGTWPLEEGNRVKIPESIIVHGVRSFTVSVFGIRETEDGKIERYNGKPTAFRVEIGGEVPGEGCDKGPTAYEQLLIRLDKKLDAYQGEDNAGRVLVVGEDGVVRPGEYAGGGGSGGGVNFTTDETLKLENGVLSVNTVDAVEEDNTLPITSAAVYQTVGNIEILLKTI